MTAQTIIFTILADMAPHLDSTQLAMLSDSLIRVLHDVVISAPARQLPADPESNDSLLRQFAASKRLEGKSHLTIAQYLRANRRFLAASGKHCTLISSLDIKYYLAVYASSGVSSTTVHNELRYLSAFFGWLTDEDYIPRNPAQKIKGIRKDTLKKYLLTDEDVERMRDAAATACDRAIIDVLASTGLRVSELAALDRSAVTPDGSVEVYATKTHSYRTVYLSARARLSLAAYLSGRTDDQPALFLSSRGQRITPRRIEDIVHQASAAAGIPHTITVHSLRRYLATSLHRRGCPITYVSRLLGHATTAMTEQYYIQLADSDLQAAHARYVA